MLGPLNPRFTSIRQINEMNESAMKSYFQKHMWSSNILLLYIEGSRRSLFNRGHPCTFHELNRLRLLPHLLALVTQIAAQSRSFVTREICVSW